MYVAIKTGIMSERFIHAIPKHPGSAKFCPMEVYERISVWIFGPKIVIYYADGHTKLVVDYDNNVYARMLVLKRALLVVTCTASAELWAYCRFAQLQCTWG